MKPILLLDALAFFLYLRIQNQVTTRAQSPSTLRETPIPMLTLAFVLRLPVLGVWDDVGVGEAVDPVLVADESILEELVVEDGAKMYPLRWIAKTLAPADGMVVLVICGLDVKSTEVNT